MVQEQEPAGGFGSLGASRFIEKNIATLVRRYGMVLLVNSNAGHLKAEGSSYATYSVL